MEALFLPDSKYNASDRRIGLVNGVNEIYRQAFVKKRQYSITS